MVVVAVLEVACCLVMHNHGDEESTQYTHWHSCHALKSKGGACGACSPQEEGPPFVFCHVPRGPAQGLRSCKPPSGGASLIFC